MAAAQACTCTSLGLSRPSRYVNVVTLPIAGLKGSCACLQSYGGNIHKSLPKSTAGACSCRCMLLFTSLTFLLACVQVEAAAAFSEAAVPAAPRASISGAGTGRLQQRRTGAQGVGSMAQRAVTNAQHK